MGIWLETVTFFIKMLIEWLNDNKQHWLKRKLELLEINQIVN